MSVIGFSTGAIAFGDVRRALDILAKHDVCAIELSALRYSELAPLLAAINDLDLRRFEYISFHAPSRFSAEDESRIVARLDVIANRGWPIILHPDSVHDAAAWRSLAPYLCFENMDKRKSIGRTAEELSQFLTKFPESGVCFDIGHAYQVDRTMTTARLLAQRFASRIKQIHVSEVNTTSEHVGVSAASLFAVRRILDVVTSTPIISIPIIIESVIAVENIQRELNLVKAMFEDSHPMLAETD